MEHCVNDGPIFFLSNLFPSKIHHADFGGDRVNFLHGTFYVGMFWNCDEN